VSDVVVKQFTFAISSLDELLVLFLLCFFISEREPVSLRSLYAIVRPSFVCNVGTRVLHGLNFRPDPAYEQQQHAISIVVCSVVDLTCSTAVLQCYRRQAIPMEQTKIRPSVTLYFLDRSSPNLVW